jgi:hypothetical protein
VPAGTPDDPSVTEVEFGIPLGEPKVSSTGKMTLLASGALQLPTTFSGVNLRVMANVGYYTPGAYPRPRK